MGRVSLRREVAIQELHGVKYRKLIMVNCHLNIYKEYILSSM